MSERHGNAHPTIVPYQAFAAADRLFVVAVGNDGQFHRLCRALGRDDLPADPRFATIARPANAAVLAKLRVDMEDRGGRIEIIIPYATLEPVRELLLQMFMGEKFGRDSIWETHLGTELLLTEMPIYAVLDEIDMQLGDVMNWKVGSQILLKVKADDMVELRAGEIPLFRGRMGRHNDNIAVRVEQATITDAKNGVV